MTTNKIYFVSLGCDKNRVDSEEMLGYLRDAGFSFTYDENEADIIVVNTCAFIDPAKEESIETILEMAALKKTGKCRKLIVAGCLAERYADEILKELPEIDQIIGVNELSKIVPAAGGDLPDTASGPVTPETKTDHRRVLTTGGHFEYLKIAEGCSKFCTYCAIPKIRGSYRSFPMEKILEEAAFLAESGVKELILVAQETTIYGTDLYGKEMLPELLRRLCKIEGPDWIRILYAYPEDISVELLETMASEEKICHYLDMPIQHASDAILKRMGRRTTRADIIEVIGKARKYMPDISLRTSLITGFPGETEEDHRMLLNFVEQMRFDHLGVFTYSQEEGTPAASFPDQIGEEVKAFRREELMLLQKEVSEEILEQTVGKTLDVFIEGRLVDEDVYAGRTYRDAPDVDGCFFVRCDHELMSGAIIKAAVTETNEYDMIGVAAE